jgi:hypothetical protein
MAGQFILRKLSTDKKHLTMEYKFDDYKIHIVDSSNYKDKFVGYIEELHSVMAILDNRADAESVFKPLFDKEVLRLKENDESIPVPGSGKAKITFAKDDKIKAMESIVVDFWDTILETSYYTSFVSNDSRLREWEHYLPNGKTDIIEKVKAKYKVDIEPIYDKPVWQVLTALKN